MQCFSSDFFINKAWMLIGQGCLNFANLMFILDDDWLVDTVEPYKTKFI